MRCLRILTSLPSLILITYCTYTSAQNQGNVFFPELRSRTGQLDERIRATARPLSIVTQQDDCMDSFLPEQCNSWKDTIGCSESTMRVGCKRTCGLCQTQVLSTQSLNLEPVLPTNPLASLPPQTPASAECSDQAVTSLCNDWRLEFGCNDVAVTTYCRKTCGLCSASPSQPSVAQGNRVISMQAPDPRPTGTTNSGHLIISHNPGNQAQNVLPIGPAEQTTIKPFLIISPAPVATSQPISVGDRNIGIVLSGGAPTISTTTAQESVETRPTLPIIQGLIPLNTLDIQINQETDFASQMPDYWKGDKSKLPFGHSGLTVAAKVENIEDVRTFIQNGANIDHQDHYGMSSLMWIAGQGNINILDLLLQAGASTNLTDSLGSSALMYAAFNDNDETVERLVDYGAEIDAKDSFGETSLMSAARLGHYYVVEKLLEKEAQVSLQDNQGMTALHYAALKQCVQCVELLIRKCPDISLKNNIEKTPLNIAKEKGNSKIMTLIEGLLQPSCQHAGETFLAGTRRVESCIELECKCGGYYEPTGKNDLSCLVLSGLL